MGRSRQELARERVPPKIRRSRRCLLARRQSHSRRAPRPSGLLVVGAASAAQRQYRSRHPRRQRTGEFPESIFTQTSSPTAKVVSAVTPAVVLTRNPMSAGWERKHCSLAKR